MFSGLSEVQEIPARRWTAVASFTLQTALVAVALVYPLLHTPSLPAVVRTLLPPVSTIEGPARTQRDSAHSGGPTIHPIVVNNDRVFSPHLTTGPEDPGVIGPPDITGLISNNYQEGLRNTIVSDYVRPMPTIATQPHAVRTSVMMEGNLIHKVEPEYPAIAKQLHIEGTVIVRAFISREGVITRAEAERGHALLAQAALAAVRQWRYRPYYLNHEPIEVETEIRVNFVLQR